MNKYRKGQSVEGIVTGIENYGIFVNFADGYTGLIHISEISNDYVKNINDYVSVNEKIKAEILSVDNKEKHLKLSIKNLLNQNSEIAESPNGFKMLEKALPKWVDEKLKEYKE